MACTIVAVNYLPFARALCRSYRRHHPDHHFLVLLIDDPGCQVAPGAEPFEILRLDCLALPPADLAFMLAAYDVTELATAVKPWLLRAIISTRADVAIYIDPDVQFYAPIDAVSKAREHGIVLTPHLLEPVDDDGLRPSEKEILASGVFNLGFIAVSATAVPMLEWWSDRLVRDCLVDHGAMLFTDQRWIDLVPGYFRHHIVRDDGWNVAYWNLHERPLTTSGGEFYAGRHPLRFFHFSGYRPERPHVLSKHQGDHPRVRLFESPLLGDLFSTYSAALTHEGYLATPGHYGYERSVAGTRLDEPSRRAFRSAYIAAQKSGAKLPPDPHDPATSAEFTAWLTTPDHRGLSPYLGEILAAQGPNRFPEVEYGQLRPFLGWVRSNNGALMVNADLVPADDTSLAQRLLDGTKPLIREFPRLRAVIRALRQSPRSTPARLQAKLHRLRKARRLAPRSLREGVNIAGYLAAELGIGEAARGLLASLDCAGIPHSTVNYSATLSRQEAGFPARDLGAPFDVNLVCVNADMMRPFAADIGPEFFLGRYTIGYWHFELDVFPESMRPSLNYVDEVWCGSTFAADAVRAVTDKPVAVVPPPVSRPAGRRSRTRSELGLPEDLTIFTFFFDFFSVEDRKNPRGLIRAFTSAFTVNDGVFLLIKTINGVYRPDKLASLRAFARRADIEVRDEYLDTHTRLDLLAACDAYVSLHRSEGFGLTIAEAMALGRPVLATGYSGNLDFMTDDNSYLVPYSLTTVPPGSEPYPAGARWADPDVARAAQMLRSIKDDPSDALQRGTRASQTISEGYTLQALAPLVRDQVDRARERSHQHLRPLVRDTIGGLPRWG